MRMPILFVGYNRPNLTDKALKQLSKLPKTKVFFSIDRSDSSDSNSKRNMEVIKLVNSFRQTSHHQVEVFVQSESVGCNQNTLRGMDYLLLACPYGVLIEDDCEFRIEYIQFLNRSYKYIDSSKFAGITPMNLNWNRDSSNHNGDRITWTSSNLMGGSLGMTFSREIKKNFDLAMPKFGTDEMAKKISENSKKFPLNFLQKPVMESYFQGKSLSIKLSWDKSLVDHSHRFETGWDSAWQLSAFYFNKVFVVPSFTLARESLEQEEGQWHEHRFTYKSWGDLSQKIEIEDLNIAEPAAQSKIGTLDKLSVKRFPFKGFLRAKYSKYINS